LEAEEILQSKSIDRAYIDRCVNRYLDDSQTWKEKARALMVLLRLAQPNPEPSLDEQRDPTIRHRQINQRSVSVIFFQKGRAKSRVKKIKKFFAHSAKNQTSSGHPSSFVLGGRVFGGWASLARVMVSKDWRKRTRA
jgi:hypothetical protein